MPGLQFNAPVRDFRRARTTSFGMNTYQSADEAAQDKAHLALLLEALDAFPSAMRRDDAGLWVLRGTYWPATSRLVRWPLIRISRRYQL